VSGPENDPGEVAADDGGRRENSTDEDEGESERPQELESMCLRALQVELKECDATKRDMADDLGAWLDVGETTL